MNISNLKIGTRLGAAFAAVLVLLALISTIGIYNIALMHQVTEDLVKQDFVKTKLATEALDNLRGSIARVFELTVSTDEDQLKVAGERLKANLGKIDDAMLKLEPMLVRPEGREIFARCQETRNLYVAAVDKTIALASGGKREEAMKLAFGETYKQLHAFADNLRAMLSFQQKQFQENGELSAQTYSTSRLQMIVISLIAIAVGVFGAIWITRTITTPINQSVSIAEVIASGDLTHDFTTPNRDETGQLIRALHVMKESLVNIVSEVHAGSETIMHATSEISQGNLDLSARTETQAAALQETASSMEELTSTVKQNADNARQADKLAQQASEVAIKGGEAVSQVVATMDAINTSSKKIVDIISVIDGIAFQTNILALNAAVEAARAGEQGRGFAVVASEVRNLAQRSAAAAKEIKQLIGDSVDKVETGSRQVDVAGTTMNEVVKSIRQVTDIMGEITSASQEQSQGIDQVNTVIISMDNTTQKNAALVEEAAAASKELENQSQQLMKVVGAFKINKTRAPTERRSTRPVEPVRQNLRTPGAGQVAVKMPAPTLIKQQRTNDEEGWEEF